MTASMIEWWNSTVRIVVCQQQEFSEHWGARCTVCSYSSSLMKTTEGYYAELFFRGDGTPYK